MNVIITTRQHGVPAPVRQRAERNVLRLLRFDPRIQEAEVIFDIDAGIHRAEARLTIAGGPMVIAHGDARDFGAALDRMTPRLKRQLRKGRRRQRARRTDGLEKEVTATL